MNVSRRKISVLAPYKVEEGSVSIFLQKRSKDAKRAPGLFGFFGGGADEGETAEQALLREIKEELDIEIKDFSFFNRYETFYNLVSLFTMQVDDNFEKEVTVLEGDYGKWFDRDSFSKEGKIIEGDVPILEELYERLSKD